MNWLKEALIDIALFLACLGLAGSLGALWMYMNLGGMCK